METTNSTSTRETRGLAIALTQQIELIGTDLYHVPSQSGNGHYAVKIGKDKEKCTCPDCSENGYRCKHIFAVQFMKIRKQQNVDGSTTVTTETLTVQATVAPRKTYKQDWPKYNAAQCNEHRLFPQLLADLCSTLPETPRKPGRGRKPIEYRDGLFCAVLKVFSLLSARRFNGDLEAAYEQGYIAKVPHFNRVLNIFNKPEVTPLLKGMIETSALPLRPVESDFTIDSTGFATTKYASWFDHKYNQTKQEQVWVKAHFVSGVKTHIVATVNIDEQTAADGPQLPALVDRAAANFKLGEVSADKAYLSNVNFDAVEKHGAAFFPMFKKNSTGGVGGSLEKAFHFFALKKEEYLQHYHKRSNVETVVSMVKRKLGDAVKAKNDIAQKNEVYAKFVCHNLSVLIQEMYTLGIDPTFGTVKPVIENQEEQPAMILKFPTAM